MTKIEAQEQMNKLNWQRDQVQEETRCLDAQLKRIIERSLELLGEHPGLCLKAPKPIKLPCGCPNPAKSKYEMCPHHRRSCGM